MRWLVRSFYRNADIVGLLLTQHCQLGAEFIEVESRHFLIEMLWKNIDIILIILRAAKEFYLRNDLIGKAVRHNE